MTTAQYQGVGNGCSNGGNSFTNFSSGVLTTPLTINGVAIPAAATTPTADPNPPGVPSFTNIQIEQSPILNGGLAFQTPFVPACDQNTYAPNAWCIQSKNQILVSYLSYTVSNAGGITFESLQASINNHANTTTDVVFREFCLGVANLAWSASANGSVACTGAGGIYHVLQVGQVQGLFQHLTENQALTFASTTNISVRDVVFLQTFNGEGSWADVTSIIDTPEPTTISLVGFALVGLGCLRLRRRKRA
ncbi:MAG TPA: PEP-CTERM sorting domain-containing protein [Bryobacteraceae bacterium]|nr:PEP-CTERM sorting domain-containing protein [Bryobacteraceae bacterium]